MRDDLPGEASGLPRVGAVVPVLLLIACGGGSGVPTPPEDRTLSSIDVVPEAALVTVVGEQTTLLAVGRDADGNVLPGITFTWGSGDEDVASVAAGGLVTAVAPGSVRTPVTITATSGGVSGTGTVWVLPPEYDAVDVNGGLDVVGNLTRYDLVDGEPVPASTAVVWPAGGAASEVPGLGGQGSTAVAVNANREVVGTARTSSGVDHAFRWTVDDPAATDLGAAGGTSSGAVDVDDDSDVLGTYRTSSQDLHAVIWAADGAPAEITDLAGTGYAPAALGLQGDVVGTVTLVGGESHAFAWTQQGGVTDLGTSGVGSAAADVDRFGDVVGSTNLPPDTTGPRGFFRTAQGTVTLLPALAGGDESHAAAVNQNDMVAGYGETPDGPHAFIWTSQAGLTDLGTLGGCCSWAYGINDAGDVVGASRNGAGELRAFLRRAADGTMAELGTLPGS